MAASAIVEGFHVLEDRALGGLPGREGRAVHELGLERAEEALHGRVVVAVALAARRPDEPVAGQRRPVGPARVLGGFKWSSRHLGGRVRDGHAEAAFGSVGARRVALAGPARGGAARGPAAVLDGDRGGAGQRGRGGLGGGGVGGGGAEGSGGGGGAPHPPRGGAPGPPPGGTLPFRTPG